MCGIAGIIRFDQRPVERGLLEVMGNALVHRGPEDSGYYIHENVGLVHRRLKIIDIETGRQPIFNEDESVLAILNGEIYNYQELRVRLEQEGHKFATKSDTEVLVHLYEKYGDMRMLDELNGMFAFVLRDVRRAKTFLVRDRTGEKPLYFARTSEFLSFASELSAMTLVPGTDLGLEPAALDCYFRYGYVPAPYSIYRNIQKLEPGHYLEISGHGVEDGTYWQIPPPEIHSNMSGEEVYGRFKELLTDSVRLRMVADVPLGVFLSGGVDSSTVAALMRGFAPEHLESFSIGFKDGSYDESAASTRIARKLGTKHHLEVLDGFDAGEFPKILAQFGEPYADSSAIPTYFLCKTTRRHVKVALSGDGADEILAGYNRYVASRFAAPFLRLPSMLRSDAMFERLAALPEDHRYYNKSAVKKVRLFSRFLSGLLKNREDVAPVVFPPTGIPGLYSREFQAELADDSKSDVVREAARYYAKLDLTSQMLWTDFVTYLPDDIHVKVDRMSMAHALEVRTPFMDHRLIEFLAEVPLNMKIRGFHTKILLRRLMAEYLGDEHKKPKHGFAAPVAHWICHDLNAQIRELFASEAAKRFLNVSTLESLLKRHESQNEDLSAELWAVYAFLVWINKVH